ncbi:hypothetical protein [Gloeobacter kilaueensis]|uniref:Uncharacterized protein n=1 Tax=Gloeobacter kilaueensis (strain ATCC BAA-2537 / CCAP 1431/1 / ULC 316 / JS1) TaxID=1183438 RepID=U5QFK5_GLOK1|nr:hypothetical protein [Gloeobacter kilaueensis]AGY56455.1 hypothetical protein GKIL_0208 [Gloeobacter kilaueensis JS1]
MDTQRSLIIKQGLKFSLGAALLGSFFWHRGDVLDNYVYPTFGYVSVLIEPAAGGAIIAGLGRVGGSALGGFIAAILLNSFGLYGSGLFIIPSITYILSAFICETYRWQAAYSQATLIGTLIAMRAVGTSDQQDIWLYLKSRLIDNSIGVAVGIAVALLFWRQDTRTELNKNLKQFLQSVPRLFQGIVNQYAMPLQLKSTENNHSPVLPADLPLSSLLNQLTKSTQASLATLTKAASEFQSQRLDEENWSAILASQNQLSRQLGDMLALADQDQQTLTRQFRTELNQFAQHLTESCNRLSTIANTSHDSDDALADLEQDLAIIKDKLNHLRSTGEISQYSTAETLQFFQSLQLLTQFIQGLRSLQNRLLHKQTVATHHQRRKLLTFPKRTPISMRRVIEIVGLGMAIGMIIAIIHHIDFPYPSAYEQASKVITVALVITLVQPTRGRAIALSLVAVIGFWLSLFLIYLLGISFGYNPITACVVYFFIYVCCATLGFTPIARVGAIIAADWLSKDIFPFFYQGLAAVAIAIPCGVLIALLITTVFMGGSAANELEKSFAQTFKQLGQLYQSLLTTYLQGVTPSPETTQLKATLAKTLAQHPMGLKIAGLEEGSGGLATRHKNLWNFLLGCEQTLFAQLGTLADELQQPMPDAIRQQYSSELQAIAQQTVNAFDQLSAMITAPMLLQSSQTASLVQKIESIEQQLLSQRVESRSYPLEQLIAFSSAFMTMKAIASNLNQISHTLPVY